MLFLQEHGPCTVKELVEGLGVAQATGSKIAKDGEALEMFTRRRSRADNRRHYVCLTPVAMRALLDAPCPFPRKNKEDFAETAPDKYSVMKAIEEGA